jgi:hypothetical protein
MKAAPLVNDAVPVQLPPWAFRKEDYPPTAQGKALSTSPQQQSLVTIDLLMLYSENMRELYPASPGAADVDEAVKARLQYMVDYANTAHQNSGSIARLHIAAIHPALSYENPHGSSAIADLQGRQGVFQALDQWRDQAHADLVTWVQKSEGLSNPGIGNMPRVPLGWVIGQYDLARWLKDQGAIFSVILDDPSNITADADLAHETGHNLGLDHDWANASPAVVNGYQHLTPFGYGYGIEGIFGDIMSYIGPEKPYFSTPLVECVPGQPCGIADRADCVRAINLVAPAVAAMR